ncbi:MAG: thiamine phosphate synthase, partial [Actinomycetota bacterium]|nr:thiamine phosphate synthase [Actinomycetota bacterium]
MTGRRARRGPQRPCPTPGCRGLHDLLEAAVRAGADAVQGPGEGGHRPCPVRLTTMVVDRLRLLGAAVIVSDRLDVALGAGTDGVHLGLADLPVRPVRHLAPQVLLVGATYRNEQHARQARDEGADYLGVRPVYATDTKQGLPGPVG